MLEHIELIADGDSLESDYYDNAIADVLRSAGFESCYHNDGARWHYNVKLIGSGRWQGFRDKQNAREDRANGFDSNRFEVIAQQLEDDYSEVWWVESVQVGAQCALWDTTEDDIWLAQNPRDEDGNRLERKPNLYSAPRVYSCGRSAGYVNSTELETDAGAMLRFAEWLESEDIYNNSNEAGAYLADEALELYDSALLAELASPRVELVWS